MKKRMWSFILLGVLFVFLTACGNTDIKESMVFNYLESTAALPVGDVFVTVKESTDIQLLALSDDGTDVYLLQSNAVDVQENLRHRTYRLLASDDVSFFYATASASNAYGVGNGFRIYRYYPKRRKTKLVYKDVSLTNFDAFLGLDEIFNFFAPTAQRGDLNTSAFCIDGTDILSEYMVAQMLNAEIEAQGLQISISDSELFFCLTDSKVFFCDTFQTLWRFDPKTKVFTKLPFDTITHFFVTDQYLFVIPETGGNVLACDFDGTRMREIQMYGAEVSELYCMVSENGIVYLKDQSNRIWRIDRDLQAETYGTIVPEADWTVKNGTVYMYANETMQQVKQ